MRFDRRLNGRIENGRCQHRYGYTPANRRVDQYFKSLNEISVDLQAPWLPDYCIVPYMDSYWYPVYQEGRCALVAVADTLHDLIKGNMMVFHVSQYDLMGGGECGSALTDRHFSFITDPDYMDMAYVVVLDIDKCTNIRPPFL